MQKPRLILMSPIPRHPIPSRICAYPARMRKVLDWREVARIVLHLDPEHESDRARRAFDSHLSRAKWMTRSGPR
jgi:hypothetical protein